MKISLALTDVSGPVASAPGAAGRRNYGAAAAPTAAAERITPLPRVIGDGSITRTYFGRRATAGRSGAPRPAPAAEAPALPARTARTPAPRAGFPFYVSGYSMRSPLLLRSNR
ncbi:hypothetical protein EVAR_5540_1 [Eumeta japonica]|uniref:Uncharacterized protein n=1 Tax=Eumeta variegata TaxID=151549 RepID=A0A4C1TBM5_EUMVA|nr:hypothetical protein EVAR_5540_1 [Eumeta japonica]